jgi:hypothetical protein
MIPHGRGRPRLHWEFNRKVPREDLQRMSVLRIRVLAAAILLLSLLPSRAGAQTAPQLLASTDVANVRSIQVIQSPDGPVLEILASRPVTPLIRRLENPLRLVVDLPNSLLPSGGKRIDFRNDQIKGVRINQYQSAPPVARIVLDLAGPVQYSWDAAGNRLAVRLHASQQASAKPPAVPALTSGSQPVAVPVNAGPGASLSLAGGKVLPGSSVTAGADTAVVRLGRGGEVRVCPGTTVSVTSSQNGHTLMLGMSTGALEAHYYLDASVDSILTPDFRIQLPGPGEFHYAISADTHGNTCVRALPRNTASVIVSELLGDGTYQVKPTEQIMFHSGRLSSVDSAIPAGCGCPPPEIPVMRASAEPLSAAKPSAAIKLSGPAQGASGTGSSALPLPATASETAPPPPLKPTDVHIQVEAPFVFRGDDPPPAELAPVREAQLLPLRPLPVPGNSALPAAQLESKSAHHGVFGKIKGFFSSLFG